MYVTQFHNLLIVGKWKKPFSNHSTTEGEFKPNNQPIIKIPMMHIMDSIEYGLFPKYKIHMISKSFMVRMTKLLFSSDITKQFPDSKC